MNIKTLIALSVRQPNIGNVQIIDWAVQRIQDLEQENKQMKAALHRFTLLDRHDPALRDDLWCLQQEESPLLNQASHEDAQDCFLNPASVYARGTTK